MKIGIDIDNVIANTFVDLAAYFNQFMGKEFEPHEVQDVMRRERLKMWAYWFLTWREKLLSKVLPIEGAAQTISNWHKEHEISLVTSRHSVFNRETKGWLKKHGVPYHKLHHAKERTKHTKISNPDIFIEDNLDECEILAEFCERAFLMDHPWNRREPSKKNITRVHNWRELGEKF